MYIKRFIDNELLIWKDTKKHKPLLNRNEIFFLHFYSSNDI